MSVKICKIDEEMADEWNRIIYESPHGTIFHTWKWLTIAGKHSGYTLHPLIGYVKNKPVALFPLFHRKKFGLNFVFSPPPHTALLYLGPVFLFDDKMQQNKKEIIYSSFLDGINDYIKQELHAQYVQVYLPPKLHDPRPFAWSGYTVKPEYNYETDVRLGADYLMENLPKKKRQDINRAYKRGITVEFGGKEELEVIYNLMVERYKEQGRSVLVPLEYLFEIYDTYHDHIKIFITKYDGEIATGLIDVHYKDSLYSWVGNPKPSIEISPSPNDLLLWEEILYCCEHGFTSYVTMGAAGNERLHTYYSSKFNPDLDVRFSAKKCSTIVGCIESAYTNAYKPVKSIMKKSGFP